MIIRIHDESLLSQHSTQPVFNVGITVLCAGCSENPELTGIVGRGTVTLRFSFFPFALAGLAEALFVTSLNAIRLESVFYVKQMLQNCTRSCLLLGCDFGTFAGAFSLAILCVVIVDVCVNKTNCDCEG